MYPITFLNEVTPLEGQVGRLELMAIWALEVWVDIVELEIHRTFPCILPKCPSIASFVRT
jgi:hypothetical protein